jgi:hypothetical protein
MAPPEMKIRFDESRQLLPFSLLYVSQEGWNKSDEAARMRKKAKAYR